jgi:membrane-bound serine protease (ClpP class)
MSGLRPRLPRAASLLLLATPVLLAGLSAGSPAGAGDVAASAASTPATSSPPRAGPTLEPAPPVVELVKVDGVIDGAMADYLVGTLEQAERREAVVVIQLDTPGTLGVPAIDVAQRVFDAEVPVIVWVGTPPARAEGAGLLIVYAASYSLTSPGSGIGPLQPLDLGRTPPEEDPALVRRALWKVEEWSAARGRDPSFASEDHAAPGAEALDRRVVEDFATSLRELLGKLDGVTVRTAAGDVTLSIGRSTVVRFHDLGIGRRILHGVSSPVAIYVLLVLGLAGIAFELTQSGVGVAGVAGTLALCLAAYGLVVVPFTPVGLGLLLGGHALLMTDVVLRRLGPLTAAGMAGFVAGSILMFRQVAAAVDLSPWVIWPAAMGAFLYYGFALTVAQKARERITSTQRGLVGLVGETRGALAPEGPVHVKGTLWRGRALDGPIPPGTRVRVRRVDGLVLRVEPEIPPGGDGEG